MGEVIVRQWSDRLFAAYVDLGDGRLTLVGSEESRQAAYEFALSVLDDPREVQNRCYNSIFASQPLAWHVKRERTSVGELGNANSDGPRCSTTPARLAPDTAGATP